MNNKYVVIFAFLLLIVTAGCISNAYLHMEVDSAESAVNKITNITQAHGGFISSSSLSSIEGRNNGQVTLRVPRADFYPAIEEIEALGTVGSKQVLWSALWSRHLSLAVDRVW